MKDKHIHEVFEIITLYRPDKVAEVELARCQDCGEVNKPLMELMQERESEAFKMMGNKSPYVFWNPKTAWSEQKILIDAKDPRIKDLKSLDEFKVD